jgi:hypothetical protein
MACYYKGKGRLGPPTANTPRTGHYSPQKAKLRHDNMPLDPPVEFQVDCDMFYGDLAAGQPSPCPPWRGQQGLQEIARLS